MARRGRRKPVCLPVSGVTVLPGREFRGLDVFQTWRRPRRCRRGVNTWGWLAGVGEVCLRGGGCGVLFAQGGHAAGTRPGPARAALRSEWSGSAEQVALGQTHPQVAERLSLCGCLHSFGDQLRSGGTGKVAHACHKGCTSGIGVHVAH